VLQKWRCILHPLHPSRAGFVGEATLNKPEAAVFPNRGPSLPPSLLGHLVWGHGPSCTLFYPWPLSPQEGIGHCPPIALALVAIGSGLRALTLGIIPLCIAPRGWTPQYHLTHKDTGPEKLGAACEPTRPPWQLGLPPPPRVSLRRLQGHGEQCPSQTMTKPERAMPAAILYKRVTEASRDC
jgi:hypothetical protein